jgi:hypothetical protein
LQKLNPQHDSRKTLPPQRESSLIRRKNLLPLLQLLKFSSDVMI